MAAGGGGSWKVAYADFITALMAFFLVMWIVNQDQEVKGSVQEYFKNPWKAALSDNTGIIPVQNASVTSSQKSHFENPSAIELNVVKRINEDLIKTYIENPEFREHHSLQVEMTPDGLLINFLDDPKDPIFKKDSAEFTPTGQLVFDTVAMAIARYGSNEIELEGHTEAGYKGKSDPWELGTSRALAARLRMLVMGVKPKQVAKVSSFGDSKPLKVVKSKDPSKPDRAITPDDPANRRVSLLLRAKQRVD